MDQTEFESKLDPCPFCGGSEVYWRHYWTTPTMGKHPTVISIEVSHHCKSKPNKVFSNYRSIRAVDEEHLIAAWNTRTK